MKTGLDILAEGGVSTTAWGRCGLVSNQASVTKSYVPAWHVLKALIGSRLVALFGPQHGFESTVQENMIESDHGVHGPTGLPVYSLYSETREPTAKMLEGIDTIVVDLQVTGCRIYTYKYTLAGCLRAAKKYAKRVVVLDRQNPITGTILEGNVLDPDTKSFVGEYPIPMRHGLTMAEAASYFNAAIGADMEIVKLSGWDPSKYWPQYGRDWVITSPNLQSFDACAVFPGMVLLEGTNFSEGRGTTLPFQFVGAPYIKDAIAFTKRVTELCKGLDGVHLRPTSFQPAFHKWQNEVCNGFQVHVIDPQVFASYRLGLATIRAAIEFGEDAFRWRDPPYEYEYKLLPIQILLGSKNLHKAFEAPNFDSKAPAWNEGLRDYAAAMSKHLLYDRRMTFGI